MKKIFMSIYCVLILLVLICFNVYAQERITLSTYYPAPYGEYEQLRARKGGWGETLINPAGVYDSTNNIRLISLKDLAGTYPVTYPKPNFGGANGYNGAKSLIPTVQINDEFDSTRNTPAIGLSGHQFAGLYVTPPPDTVEFRAHPIYGSVAGIWYLIGFNYEGGGIGILAEADFFAIKAKCTQAANENENFDTDPISEDFLTAYSGQMRAAVYAEGPTTDTDTGSHNYYAALACSQNFPNYGVIPVGISVNMADYPDPRLDDFDPATWNYNNPIITGLGGFFAAKYNTIHAVTTECVPDISGGATRAVLGINQPLEVYGMLGVTESVETDNNVLSGGEVLRVIGVYGTNAEYNPAALPLNASTMWPGGQESYAALFLGDVDIVGLNDNTTYVVMRPGGNDPSVVGEPQILLGVGLPYLPPSDPNYLTSKPQEELHVKEVAGGPITNRSYLQLLIEGTDNMPAGIALRQGPGATNQWEIQALQPNSLIFYDRTKDQYRLTIDTNGNVGIGTTIPGAKLEVVSTPNNKIRLDGTGGDTWISFLLPNNYYARVYGSVDGTGSMLRFLTQDGGSAGERMRITRTGNVGIGTTNPMGKLDVNGSIYQRGAPLHADYVFEPAYQLESIEEHAIYMWKNKHLKAVNKPAQDESGQEIIELGTMNRGILEELEKAHIYIAQLNEQIKELKKEINKLK